jgi:YhcH/YjgK/YiaL family protein
MIVAALEDSERCAVLHPGFAGAFLFLRKHADGALPEGKHAVAGEYVFAIVSSAQGRGREASPLEAHRQYIDIQYIVRGTDRIGWKPLSRCKNEAAPFDVGKDCGFYADAPETWVDLPAGTFAVFFPEDAHAPLAGSGTVEKIVMKVRIAP